MKKYKSYSNFVPNNHIFIKFTLPKKISLGRDFRASFLNFLNDLNLAVKSGKRYILFDFSRTTLIVADAMVVFYAEVRNILNYDRKIKFRCTGIEKNRVEQVLKQIKFFKLCKYQSKVKLTRSDVIHWKFCFGTYAIGKDFDKVILQDSTYKDLRDGAELYSGCTEATINVIRHAYMEENRAIPVSTNKESWWCFTQIKDNKLHVIICDLGVSIPYTLPKKKKDLVGFLRGIFGKKLTDADMLEGAIGAPTSRSGENYRGNGLPTMREIARINGGILTIFSRNGMVRYEGENPEPFKYNFDVPLQGTVIAWTLPLGAKDADNIHS